MSAQSYGPIGYPHSPGDSTFSQLTYRTSLLALTPSPRRSTGIHARPRCYSTKSRLFEHSEESPSESELIIRDIIAKHRPRNVPLSDFKAGIQEYQATQEEMKSQCERMKRVIKKRTLAKLRREKLRINPNIDGEGWREDVLGWDWERRDGGEGAQALTGTANALQWVALRRLPRASNPSQRALPRIPPSRPSVS